ncbi:MAG: rRNA maturation RNase YbeY [Clostridiales Family XIII bacterium]|jgi:probable rRNA maturation factor|nr:rRNA maturation RNase YbeY [Clostridiales Family XIII bacterium]
MKSDKSLFPDPEMLAYMDAARAEVFAEQGFGGAHFEVSVSFVSEAEIRDYNRTYRGVDRVTDVLSFPQYDHIADIHETAARSAAIPVILGDIVICTDRAVQQAAEYGHSIQREITYLYVHSLLHLFGYDHEDDVDKKLMRRAEEQVMRAIGLGEETLL